MKKSDVRNLLARAYVRAAYGTKNQVSLEEAYTYADYDLKKIEK